ncbi:hypothetical protein CG736_18050 [Kitasatospora sp. CB02891]|nr:hypothetical protein CG736_18050 [Kitasatospora sp. CB02891]
MPAAGRTLGAGELPPPEPVLTLFANLMGSLVVVWALLRLLRPLPVHGRYDSAARLLFACRQALAHGATGLLWASSRPSARPSCGRSSPTGRLRHGVGGIVGGGVQSRSRTARTGVRIPRSAPCHSLFAPFLRSVLTSREIGAVDDHPDDQRGPAAARRGRVRRGVGRPCPA